MALDKAIKYGKEHRKPYSGAKAVSVSCRNHGGCPWCAENRTHKFRDKHPVERTEKDELFDDSTQTDCGNCAGCRGGLEDCKA